MAVALMAEYGEFCPSSISLSGSSWTKSSPASAIHDAKRPRSGISPIPHLARDGIEKSGAITPASRPESKRPRASGIGALHRAANPVGERRRLRQQAHDEKRFVGEVEEEAGVNQHAVPFDQIDDEVLLAARRRRADHGRPAGLRVQDV